MAEAKQEGCIVGLLTNGVLLNAKMAQELVDGGIDWICFSMDSSDKVEYERIRVGSNFDLVCRNIRHFSDLRLQGTKVMLNYVMMRSNIDQLPQLVELAAELGIDHINFKQCEVIRGVRGKDLGLFQEAETLETRRREALVDVARGLATKLGIRANVTPFIPVERCVCEQDPRNSMFVRFDGAVSPCINLANGGPTTFLGRDVVLPDISYGALPDNELPALWDSEVCLRYRTIFGERCRQYENVFMEGLVSDSRRTPQRLLEIAKRRMPRPPSGCEICHYLYGL
jgi:MoaA/NifB/PqqE/SkfB family radical SAM enzyme